MCYNQHKLNARPEQSHMCCNSTYTPILSFLNIKWVVRPQKVITFDI